MFKSWKKNRAIKKILRILPSSLQKRYGDKEYYTIGQVERTLEEENIDLLYSGYTLVMFLSPDDAVNSLGSASIYQDLRKEIADQYFDSNINFKVKEVVNFKVANTGHSSGHISGDGP